MWHSVYYAYLPNSSPLFLNFCNLAPVAAGIPLESYSTLFTKTLVGIASLLHTLPEPQNFVYTLSGTSLSNSPGT